MTPKRIEYDAHAESRMRQRGFTRSDVRALLAQGLWSPEKSRAGAEPRFSKRAYVRGREARVVYLENAVRLYIITVEWIGDAPGQPEEG